MRRRFILTVIVLILLFILVGAVMFYVDQKAHDEATFGGTAFAIPPITKPVMATYLSQTLTAAAWTKTPTTAITITP